MKIIRSLQEIKKTESVVITLGNFDGVHKGHQKIIQKVLADSKKRGAKSCVLTFDTHPRKVIFHNKKMRLLHVLEHKLSTFDELGIDYVLLLPFNQRIRNLSKESFLKNYLPSEKLSKVIVGYDFHFARNREGNVDSLASFCKEHAIPFLKVNAQSILGDTISSSRIRILVKEGNLSEAKKCLGRPYSVFGRVVKGSGIGNKMGIRTANVLVQNELFPPVGVYFVAVRRFQQRKSGGRLSYSPKNESVFFGLAYRGPLPKFNQRKNESIVEVFIYGFRGNLYDQFMEVSFLEFVREPQKVESLDELQKLIKNDIQKYTKKYQKLRKGK